MALKGTGGESDPRFGVAGGADIWKVNGTDLYIVYQVPGTEDDPVYMRWKIPSLEDFQSFFGPDQKTKVDVRINSNDPMFKDSVDFGSSDDIANTSTSPFDSWASTLAVESQSKPWILDKDYQQLFAMAMIEGRALTDGEIRTTKWWRGASETQRDWMTVSAGDPATAEQMIQGDILSVTDAMLAAGIDGANEGLIKYVATQLTQGNWDLQKVNDQIKRMSDPFFDDEPLDAGLQGYIDENDIEYGRTTDQENEVRNTVQKWLGTNFGDWSDEQVADWAGRIRNDPNALESLTETLKDQKTALFSEYDREADYQTISAPWRTMMRNMWGEVPDDSDVTLQNVIRMNSAPDASRLLTEEGLNRGNNMVVNNVQGALDRSFGGL